MGLPHENSTGIHALVFRHRSDMATVGAMGLMPKLHLGGGGFNQLFWQIPK
jgi:hypothetical protein